MTKPTPADKSRAPYDPEALVKEIRSYMEDGLRELADAVPDTDADDSLTLKDGGYVSTPTGLRELQITIKLHPVDPAPLAH